ncbi:MAG: hypothetical protein KA139_06205 [Rhodobacteraceae bacterium]|nr:hypothetical protein [Paracoccaceae bacterium]
MSLQTSARDEALLEDIAGYFDILASDSEAMARRGYSKRDNTLRAKVWREAAADVRSIKLVDPTKETTE